VEEPAKVAIQESIEKTAALTEMLFGAPPPALSYAVILASALAGLLLAPGPQGLLAGLLLLALPGLVAAAASTPLARALGRGTFYHRRSAFLSAVSCVLVAATLGGTRLLGAVFQDKPVHGLLLGYAMLLALRHSVLFATCDNRHTRSLPNTLLPYAVALPLSIAVLPFGPREAVLAVLLPLLHIGGAVFYLSMFDAPLKKNFDVSAFDLFRYFLDHFTTGNPYGETVMDRFAEPIQAKVGVVAFRRTEGPQKGRVKATIVVPALHPGPVGELGGGDLPGKVAEQVTRSELVLVPHGPATHDFNPISTAEVERVGKAVNEALARMEFRPGGSAFVGPARGVRVCTQLMGDGALLTYTSWPEPIDDVSYGVGHAAELSARIAGAKEAIFIDCHNSLTPGAGAVYPCTPRADRIVELAHDATVQAGRERVEALRVGVAQLNPFRREEGIGKQGVQCVLVEAGPQKVAYLLLDGNNMLPEVTEHIARVLEGQVDKFQVMTSDNHSVNLIAGGFNPVGYRVAPERVAGAAKDAVQRALADLEPVECGALRLTVSGLRVFGHEKTARLTSSINAMVSIAPQILVAWAVTIALATTLLFLATRPLAGL
jgi:putative membrane protein